MACSFTPNVSVLSEIMDIHCCPNLCGFTVSQNDYGNPAAEFKLLKILVKHVSNPQHQNIEDIGSSASQRFRSAAAATGVINHPRSRIQRRSNPYSKTVWAPLDL